MRLPFSRCPLLAVLLLAGCQPPQGEDAARAYLLDLAHAIDHASILRNLLFELSPAETDSALMRSSVGAQAARFSPPSCISFESIAEAGVVVRSDTTYGPALRVTLNGCRDATGPAAALLSVQALVMLAPGTNGITLATQSQLPYYYDSSNNGLTLPSHVNYRELPSGDRQLKFPDPETSSSYYPVNDVLPTEVRWQPGDPCLTFDKEIQVLPWGGEYGYDSYRLKVTNLAVCPDGCVRAGQTANIEFFNYVGSGRNAETGQLDFGENHRIDWRLGPDSGSFTANPCEL